MNGIILIDKPQGWTSMDVCAKLRGLLGERRIGHAGTLDPLATGVLTVFVGRATRAAQFAEGGEKEYQAVLRLGVETDTQDCTGVVLARCPVLCSRAEIETALVPFRGEIQQVPPMYSALKRNGKKLYELARQGKTIARDPRPVTIHTLELGAQVAEDSYLLRVRCSKGTYVRTLCHDIGAALGCGGCMDALRRTEASGFPVSQCHTLAQVEEAAQTGRVEALLLPVDRLFQDHPALTVSGVQERLCRNGNPFRSPGRDGLFRVYGSEGEFLMLGRRNDGEMRTVKSFF